MCRYLVEAESLFARKNQAKTALLLAVLVETMTFAIDTDFTTAVTKSSGSRGNAAECLRHGGPRRSSAVSSGGPKRMRAAPGPAVRSHDCHTAPPST